MEIKSQEALDEGNVSRYVYYMNESKKLASNTVPVNKKRKEIFSQKFVYTKSSLSLVITRKERIAHLMDIIRNA